MMSLPASVRIYLCTTPCDMRKSFDGLQSLAAHLMGLDPFAGHFYVFANARRDRVKILYWDRDGFVKPTKENPQSRVHPSAAPLSLASLVRSRLAHTQSRRSERLDGLLLQAS